MRSLPLLSSLAGRFLAAFLATLLRSTTVFFLAAAASALFAVARFLVHSGPSSALRLFLRRTALLLALLDMFRFALLFIRISAFTPLGIVGSPSLLVVRTNSLCKC